MRIAFIGHRTVDNAEHLKTKITQTVLMLIADGADTFLFGSRSQFDTLCWEVVTELKEQHPDIRRVCYNAFHETAFTSKEERERYERLYSQIAKQEVHCMDYEEAIDSPKSLNANQNAYIMRNQEMIDNSDVCVFYYNPNYLPPKRKRSSKSLVDYQPQSGTAVAHAYAKRKKRKIINIFIKKNSENH